MQAHHTDEMRELLASFEEQVVVEVDGLGAGAARSRLATNGRGVRDAGDAGGESPRVQRRRRGARDRDRARAHPVDREVAGIRSANAGSVGLPYEGRPGAYWALLGPDVELRRNEYDVDETIERYRRSGQPWSRADRRDDGRAARATRGDRARREGRLRRLGAIASVRGAAAWVDRVGLAVLYPNDDLVLPSLWEALTGRQDVDWAVREDGGKFVDFTPDFARVWSWKDELPEQRLVCAGKHLGGRAFTRLARAAARACMP